MLVHAGPRWSTLAHAGPCWPAHVGPRWSTLAHAGPRGPTRAHARWPTLAHAGTCWPTQAHAGHAGHVAPRWPTLAHAGAHAGPRWPTLAHEPAVCHSCCVAGVPEPVWRVCLSKPPPSPFPHMRTQASPPLPHFLPARHSLELHLHLPAQAVPERAFHHVHLIGPWCWGHDAGVVALGSCWGRGMAVRWKSSGVIGAALNCGGERRRAGGRPGQLKLQGWLPLVIIRSEDSNTPLWSRW
jgi:hypothetical protein